MQDSRQSRIFAKKKYNMEFSFIIGVIGTWLLIALAKGAEWIGGSEKNRMTDEEILEEEKRCIQESRKWLEEHIPEKY